MFVHRYTQKQFNKTSLSNIEAEKTEVLALWDMLQRYMDVTQPLPDMPRLEPFRHLDPVTAKYDQTTSRNPRYWRDLDLEDWQKGEGAEILKKQRQYAWGRRQCRVTPQLGSVDMPTRSEEHTSELQSRPQLVCRLLLEKKKRGRRGQGNHDVVSGPSAAACGGIGHGGHGRGSLPGCLHDFREAVGSLLELGRPPEQIFQ